MRKNWVSFLTASAVVALGLALAVQGVAQAQKKGKERVALTKYLMKGVNAPNCASLGKLVNAETQKDEDWEAIKMHASVVNEMGYVLMDDGRCPDADWANATKALRECSAAVLAAAEKKDVAGAREAFKQLTSTGCGVCHKAHRK